MPWKKCPDCGGISYSAATLYTRWLCPYCGRDIAAFPDIEPVRDDEAPDESIDGSGEPAPGEAATREPTTEDE